MARPGEIFLHINLIATEECFSFALSAIHCLLHGFGIVYNFHAATTATECSLDGNWVTGRCRELCDLLCSCDEIRGSRNDRTTTAQRSTSTRNLVSHFTNGITGRSDEGHTHVGDRIGEVGILAEESVTRMNSVGATFADGIKNGFGVEVTLGSSLTA